MAWIYALCVECGTREDRARDLVRHFSDWPARSFSDGTGWWCEVAPDGLGQSGATSEANAAAMTAAGHRLYEVLRTAPAVYRYALAGVETSEFRTYEELMGEDEDLTIFPGLVISHDIRTEIGEPAAFTPFSPGYQWIPYQGETYIPLR